MPKTLLSTLPITALGTGLPRAAIALAAALVVIVPALTSASSAQAHDSVIASTPTEGEVLATLPTDFSVTTNEPLLTLDDTTSGFALEIVDSAGYYYGDGCLTVSGATLSTPAALGEPGDYLMIWQVVSSDGHPASGEIGFSWAPSDAAAPATGSATPPVCSGGEPTSEASAPAADEPTQSAVPISAPDVRPNASLSDVLWIGGAIAAVLGAVLVTFLVLSRRTRRDTAEKKLDE
jgi:methionine-rich copper-binding protein CopC